MSTATITEDWVICECMAGPMLGMKAVCKRTEWETVKSRYPGRYRIVREGMPTEAEAEKLARGNAGDIEVRDKRSRSRFF